MKQYLLLIFALFIAQTVLSQDELPPINTDRPDQSESPLTLPKKTFQIESGFTFGWDKQDGMEKKDLGYNSTLFRYGLLNRLELRLGSGYAGLDIKDNNIDSSYTKGGMIPIYVGLKWNILEGDGPIPTLAFLTHVDIPKSGGKDFQETDVIQNFILAGSWDLSKVFALSFNLGGYMNWKESNFTGKNSITLGASILSWLGAYVEFFAFNRTGEYDEYLFDCGLTFPVRNNLQFDVSYAVGLNKYAPDGFAGVGFAWRIPR